MSQLTVEQREVLEKDLAKKERKDQAKAEREEAKLAVRRPPFGVSLVGSPSG